MEQKTIRLVQDPWFSEVMERNVYKVFIEEPLSPGSQPTKSNSEISIQALQKRPVFAFSKVDASATSKTAYLESIGFRLVDTNVTFDKKIEKKNFVDTTEVRVAQSNDRSSVEQIARESFIFSRFHLDPQMSIDLANRIKEEWVRNYFLGNRGDAMIVGLIDGCVAGFLLLMELDDDTILIDLIAVHNAYQRHGLASKMIHYISTVYPNATQLRVGTQVANIPSIRLYEKLGFRLFQAQYVLHFHNI